MIQKIPKQIMLKIVLGYLNNLRDIYSVSLVSKNFHEMFLANLDLFNVLLNKYRGVYTRINPDLKMNYDGSNMYNRVEKPEKLKNINWTIENFAKLMLCHGLIHEQKRKEVMCEYSKWLSYSVPIPKTHEILESLVCKNECNRYYNLVKYFDNKHWGLYNKLLGTIEFQKGPFNNWFYYTFDDAINYYFGL